MILVKLQPQVRERVGRIIGVGNRLGAAYTLVLVVEFHSDNVVCFLLPVLMPGSAGRCTVGVRRGKKLVELLEFARDVVSSVANTLRKGRYGRHCADTQR